MKMRDKNLAFVDVETTGLDPDKHEIIQIAILIEDQKTNNIVNQFTTRIKPQYIERASPKALSINGYDKNPELWDKAPLFNKDMALTIANYLKGCILIGQNVGFDKGFIQKALKNYDMWDWVGHHTIDTASLAIEHLGPLGIKSVSLRNVCQVLNVSNENEHDALADVIRCREVYKKLNRAGILKRLWWGINIKFNT